MRDLSAVRALLDQAITAARGAGLVVKPSEPLRSELKSSPKCRCLLMSVAGIVHHYWEPAMAKLVDVGVTSREAAALEVGFENWFNRDVYLNSEGYSSNELAFFDLGQEYRRNALAYLEGAR
jgi:hypothetical protein